ncbi:hypothetical protein [Clostridium cylindrosporum]|uniref:Uncharacterized protein n=1 Tax=Clostridium cylindrosporum DSM 605 TaxID=1121307 RepID=A0A0J8G196_CLOCY|nr:hypothetical protein [Clostridium cylindrosporum]KMT21516.1 hypothetical protein CLCY_2c02770 [Clostridium cylindrosporum DSM 605]
MNVLERLKIELSNKDYFTDAVYTMYLEENGLNATAIYNKTTMEKQLLLSIVSILEAVSNDIDLMRRVADDTTGFSIDSASKYLEQRIDKIKDRILDMEVKEQSSIIKPFIVRKW